MFKTITWEKNVGKISSLSSYNDEIEGNTKSHFYMDEKLFRSHCTKNDLAKYF